MATIAASATHVSPYCIRVEFADSVTGNPVQMRNNASLTLVTNYSVPGVSILSVELPTAQSQSYVGPGNDGGAPTVVYLILDGNPYTAPAPSTSVVTVANGGLSTWIGGAVAANNPTSSDIKDVPLSYWNAEGIRTNEVFRELPKLGRAKFSSDRTHNYGIAQLLGKVFDLASGGMYGKLGTAIAGPADPSYLPPFSGSGFSLPLLSAPGIGDSFDFVDGIVPCHVDKLWGACDGTNDIFRTSLPYHSFSCVVIAAPGPAEGISPGLLDNSAWFSPEEGKDRILRLVDAPPAGSSLIAIYVPRCSLLRIGGEIIAYEECAILCDDSDVVTAEAVIYGRDQLCTDLEEHYLGSIMEDVWAVSMVNKTRYSMQAFGASGRPLEYIGADRGSPKSDNPSLSDTEFRRMIFNTSVTMRGVPGTVRKAVRYVYPDLYPFIVFEFDPRWRKCLTVWYSTEQIGIVATPATPVEPWETWLDHVAWPDGMPLDLLYETYWRDPIGDVTYDGDYFLSDWTNDPDIAPYPVVVYGPDVHIMGTPAPYIPDPYWVSDDYRRFLCRPVGLDKALPAGCGVLILNVGLM